MENKFKQNKAHYLPLTPISFLKRTARIFPKRHSIIYNKKRFTWAETYDRCMQLAGALKKNGLKKNDVVLFFSFNTPELFEAHFGVAMANGVLCACNIRLNAPVLQYIIEHSEAKLIFVDKELNPIVKEALKKLKQIPKIIDIVDPNANTDNQNIGEMDYEQFLASADECVCALPENELDPIALNYTSGTTGNPKGVVYHHRGAYLMSMGCSVAWNMQLHKTYLYTVPMFHCNGWGHAWTQTLLSGTLVCIRKIIAEEIFGLINEHKVEYFGGAPIVLSMLANLADESKKYLNHQVHLMTAGSPPPSQILKEMEQLGFNITHVYGLTESFGHVLYSAYQDEWDELDSEDKAQMKAMQGVGLPILEDWSVLDEHGKAVPHDGKTIGEIVLRGNTLMLGYLKNEQATDDAFQDGWFRTGDLGVMHPNQYIQIKDRLKDIIISGGENISSVEIENVLCKHPKVMLAAVVAKPDMKWGETPCAFIQLKNSNDPIDLDEIKQFCRENLAHFKCPSRFEFVQLPQTSTGKIKKYELREQAKLL